MIKDLFLQKFISHMHVCSKCMDDNLFKNIKIKNNRRGFGASSNT